MAAVSFRPAAAIAARLSPRRTPARARSPLMPVSFSTTASTTTTSNEGRPQQKQLVLYSKPGCCLCDGLKEKLIAALSLGGPHHLTSVQLEVRDITENPEWERLYQYEIPVLAKLLPDGTEEYNLDSDIVKEFDGLRVANEQKRQRSRNDGRQQSAGKALDHSKHCGEILDVKVTEGTDVLNVYGVTVDCNGISPDIQESLDQNEDINDEYESSSDELESIQRPAFFVEGEPDFESGPPLDGLEYLRRVRWEAAHIPKVKVVKLNSSKITNEQTPYMPNIPDIPKCPPNLLPSKLWENALLADFSQLRQAISVHERSCNNQSHNEVGEDTGKQSDILQQLKENTPTLTAILKMDAVSRAAALRKTISSLEGASALSRDDCLWLFALCAAVDAPLHADTCASLRCLLRKCSSLLALKSEVDDEVAMLSVLMAIAGKYFGQLDNL